MNIQLKYIIILFEFRISETNSRLNKREFDKRHLIPENHPGCIAGAVLFINRSLHP